MSDPLAPADVARLMELASKATPGPWECDVWIATEDGGWAAVGPVHDADDDDDEPGCPSELQAQADRAYMEAAISLAPALARAAARLEGENAELVGALMHSAARNHDASAGCSGCMRVASLIEKYARASAPAGEGK